MICSKILMSPPSDDSAPGSRSSGITEPFFQMTARR
jgi:hypothetical protein